MPRSSDRHPAACPYCGGTNVNVAQPDYLLRPARLNDDGSITIGQNNDACDFLGLTLLFCAGCASTYPQPASVVEHFEHFEDEVKDHDVRSPGKDEPRYIGADVVWLPLTPGQVTEVVEALDTHEYWDLAERLPRNNGCVFLPDDDYSDRYWDGEPSDVQVEAIGEVKACRELALFLATERDRQLAGQPPYTREAA